MKGSPAMRKRPQNVLIFLGSPREDGNSTRLAFAFADAASRSGHAVQTIRLSALEFAPCDGCGDCWPQASRPCALRDDLDSVYPLLRKADERSIAAVWHRIGHLLDEFSPAECSAYFRHAGYASV